MNFKYYYIVVLLAVFISCKDDDYLPKPKGFLRLEYPKVTYEKSKTVPYEFETNNKAQVLVNSKSWMRIKYPELKASIDITYRPVKNNITKLFKESDKLTIKHASKANEIYSDQYIDKRERVYGALNNVTGNVASPLQFHVTDSVKHFLVGSVYFDSKPNYDSIYPAIKFIERDVKHLMSTVKWRN